MMKTGIYYIGIGFPENMGFQPVVLLLGYIKNLVPDCNENCQIGLKI